MTKIKKIIMLFIILSICITPKYVAAQDIKYINTINTTCKSHQVQILIYDFNSSLDQIYSGKTLNKYAIKAQNVGDDLYFHTLVKWENPNYIIQNGNQEINIILYTYEGKVTIPISIYGNEEPTTTNNDNLTNVDEELVAEEITTPSLTASTLTLSTSSTFDININNKPSGNTTYKWSSSNDKVVKVDSKGVVSSVSDGQAKIKCDITDSNGQTTTLLANVTVGLDENMPVLSDSEIELDVGDKYDLDVENFESGSKIKFSSSDKSTAKVSTSKGVVTGLKDGNCLVTCTVTYPDKSVCVMRCDVSVSK